MGSPVVAFSARFPGSSPPSTVIRTMTEPAVVGSVSVRDSTPPGTSFRLFLSCASIMCFRIIRTQARLAGVHAPKGHLRDLPHRWRVVSYQIQNLRFFPRFVLTFKLVASLHYCLSPCSSPNLFRYCDLW
jgi:hypothetical protein